MSLRDFWAATLITAPCAMNYILLRLFHPPAPSAVLQFNELEEFNRRSAHARTLPEGLSGKSSRFIRAVDVTAANPMCCGDSGGRAGFLTKPYKIEEVQILESELVLGSVQ